VKSNLCKRVTTFNKKNIQTKEKGIKKIYKYNKCVTSLTHHTQFSHGKWVIMCVGAKTITFFQYIFKLQVKLSFLQMEKGVLNG